MQQIALADAINALREEFARAIEQARDKPVQFPVGEVTVEFHVGVTKAGEGKAGLNVWLLELGGSASVAAESIQRVTVVLGPPLNLHGEPIKVAGGSDVEYQ